MSSSVDESVQRNSFRGVVGLVILPAGVRQATVLPTLDSKIVETSDRKGSGSLPDSLLLFARKFIEIP